MHPAVVSALAAIAGSAIGAMAPDCQQLFSLASQLQRDVLLRDLEQRQNLYVDFLDESSRLYALSLTRDLGDVEEMLALFALSSRMRLFASDTVLHEAEKLVREIAMLYGEPNKTVDELRREMLALARQPFEGFSVACRDELFRLRDLSVINKRDWYRYS